MPHTQCIYFISSVPNQDPIQTNGTGTIKHCHDNSRAQEDRETERKVARKRLYLVSVICLIFMIGEILGECPSSHLVASSLIFPKFFICTRHFSSKVPNIFSISVTVLTRSFCRWLFCRQPRGDDGRRSPAGGLHQLHHQLVIPLALLQTGHTQTQLWLAPRRYGITGCTDRLGFSLTLYIGICIIFATHDFGTSILSM